MKMPVERLIFIDEFAINTAMTRSHARAPRGERAEVSEPGYHEPNTSVIGALSLTGINALMTIEGAVDTQVFDLFVEHFLVPKLIKGDLVVLDNVKFHYSQRAIELIEAAVASSSTYRLIHLTSTRSRSAFQRSSRFCDRSKLGPNANSTTRWQRPSR
jgi:DDE superfamily endonuclease